MHSSICRTVRVLQLAAFMSCSLVTLFSVLQLIGRWRRHGPGSGSDRASMVFIWIGRGPSRKALGRNRGTLARPGVSVTSRAWPGLDFYRGDEPGGIRKRQSLTRQSDRFKLG